MLVTHLENVAGFLAEVNVLVHHVGQFLDIFDPVIPNRVRQSSEDVITVFHSTRQNAVDLLILCFVINEIEHIDNTTGLTKTYDSSKTLFES